MRMTAAGLLSTLSLLAACGDAPAPTTPRVADEPGMMRGSLVEQLSRRGPNPLRVRDRAPTGFTIVADPLDPHTVTYTFDDVPDNCNFNVILANPYEDLNFLTTPYLGGCLSPNGTMAIVPSNEELVFDLYEVRIQLPFAASAASIEVYSVSSLPMTLNAYDAGGVLMTSATVSSFLAWGTLAVSGSNIHQLGFLMYQGFDYIDNLKITYREDPTNKDQCKDGGWAAYGFKSQGQCVRFVETGKGSRTS